MIKLRDNYTNTTLSVPVCYFIDRRDDIKYVIIYVLVFGLCALSRLSDFVEHKKYFYIYAIILKDSHPWKRFNIITIIK